MKSANGMHERLYLPEKGGANHYLIQIQFHQRIKRVFCTAIERFDRSRDLAELGVEFTG